MLLILDTYISYYSEQDLYWAIRHIKFMCYSSVEGFHGQAGESEWPIPEKEHKEDNDDNVVLLVSRSYVDKLKKRGFIFGHFYIYIEHYWIPP